MINVPQFEVDWYRKNGKHPERIVETGDDAPYVIGDASWNNGSRPDEVIEPAMRRAMWETPK